MSVTSDEELVDLSQVGVLMLHVSGENDETHCMTDASISACVEMVEKMRFSEKTSRAVEMEVFQHGVVLKVFDCPLKFGIAYFIKTTKMMLCFQ